MFDLILISGLTNLVFTVIAVVVLILTLRALDALSGFDFREWLHDADDPSKAFYFGARIVAGAIIIGSVVSIPI